MFVSALCKLCEIKRAKRFCPGADGEICPACCGRERESTIACPLDCEFLREARLHERPVQLDERTLPNADIRLTEKFVREQEPIIMYLCVGVAVAMHKNNAVDADAREALEALIRTYRTLESGLIYETRTPNPYAAGIQEELKKSVDELRKMLAEKRGMGTLRDADILGCLAFLQRLELQHSNGRPKSRAFLHFLASAFPAQPPGEVSAEEPGIQL
jgi:hypothetical protein